MHLHRKVVAAELTGCLAQLFAQHFSGQRIASECPQHIQTDHIPRPFPRSNSAVPRGRAAADRYPRHSPCRPALPSPHRPDLGKACCQILGQRHRHPGKGPVPFGRAVKGLCDITAKRQRAFPVKGQIRQQPAASVADQSTGSERPCGAAPSDRRDPEPPASARPGPSPYRGACGAPFR